MIVLRALEIPLLSPADVTNRIPAIIIMNTAATPTTTLRILIIATVRVVRLIPLAGVLVQPALLPSVVQTVDCGEGVAAVATTGAKNTPPSPKKRATASV